MHHRGAAMKILAILAALVASTTITSAQPKLEASVPSRTAIDVKRPESTGRLILGDRKPPPPKRQTLVDGWAEITDATPARFGTVFVRGTAGPFSKLRIAVVTGTVVIRRVEVHYVDGTAKVFALRTAVNARKRPSAIIDLGGPKMIEQIDITTDRRPAGEYALYGAATSTLEKQRCC